MVVRYDSQIENYSGRFGPESTSIVPPAILVEANRPTVSFPREILQFVKIELDRNMTEFTIEIQDEGGFVAFSKQYEGAVGQGETEEEAIKDLEQAIELLKEVLEEQE